MRLYILYLCVYIIYVCVFLNILQLAFRKVPQQGGAGATAELRSLSAAEELKGFDGDLMGLMTSGCFTQSCAAKNAATGLQIAVFPVYIYIFLQSISIFIYCYI